MPNQIRCPCHGKPDCRLCRGGKFYRYQPGPRGWLPFRCPTCQGAGVLRKDQANPESCYTCERAGMVDPANPPVAPGWRGHLWVAWKVFFGGG